MLVLDAICTGAKGINLWSSFRTPPPQRSARLYRALVETGLASSVSGGVLPTEHPFLYLVSATAMDGAKPADVEGAATEAINAVSKDGVTDREVVKAINQLRARLVFENDSVTNLGHQLGYFETVAATSIYKDALRSISAATVGDVNRVARKYLRADRRTVGWFNPQDGEHA
jgi:zinc protease